MKHTERDWLRKIPWEVVLCTNQTFGETQQTGHQIREKTYPQAQMLWQQAATNRMPLPDAIDVCRRCYDLGPFVFNNGNTFAAIARKLIEEWVQLLPPVEAQIARTTVGHYVVGQVTRKEMVDVLTQFEARWRINSIEPLVAPSPLRELRPQAEARAS